MLSYQLQPLTRLVNLWDLGKKYSQPWPGDVPSYPAQLWEARVLPGSVPQFPQPCPAASSLRDPRPAPSSDTQAFSVLPMRPLQEQIHHPKESNLKLRLPSLQGFPVQHNPCPVSCPGMLYPGTVASVKHSVPRQTQCPRVNEMLPGHARQKMELRWNVNGFHWQSLKSALGMFCSHLAVAHLLRRRAPDTLALDPSEAQVFLCAVWLWLCRPLLFFGVSSQRSHFPRKS